MVVIDTFSKYADVIPMKENNSESVLVALKQAFKKMGTPMSIYSDNDGAFQANVKKFFDDEGIKHILTSTHANVAERFIRTMKKMIHDRVRFNNAPWTSMLTPSLNSYNNKKHSSTGMSPKQAHKDDNQLNVAINLTNKARYRRKYPPINEGDEVKIYKKNKGNYIDRKETTPKWSIQKYKVKDIKYDIMGNKTYVLDGITRAYLRHEILLVS